MDKYKLLLPISIILGCIILGGFVYAVQIQKQRSIEKQQQIDIQAKKAEQKAIADKEEAIKTQKAHCVTEAQKSAIESYKKSYVCTIMYAPENCNDGSTYLVAQYENYYDICLQENGLK